MITCRTNIEFEKMLFAFLYTTTNNKSSDLQLKFFILFIRTFVYNERIVTRISDFLEINLTINQKLYISDVTFRILHSNFYHNHQISIIRVYSTSSQQHVCFLFSHEHQ